MRFLQELERMKGDFAAGSAAAGVTARPFVTACFAMSCDGCLSQTRGCATRISGPETLRVAHELRARHDALVVGVGTVLVDDPALTTRLVAGPSPLRIVLDSRLRVPPTARVLRSTGRGAWVVTSAAAPDDDKARALSAAGAALIHVPGEMGGVSLPALLPLLAAGGVRSLMLEGGAAVLESFFRAGLIDYLVLTVAPRRLGNPRAVRVGPRTREVLRGFRALRPAAKLGDDEVAAGPVAPAPGEAPARWAAS